MAFPTAQSRLLNLPNLPVATSRLSRTRYSWGQTLRVGVCPAAACRPPARALSPAWRLLHGGALVLHVKFTRGSVDALVKKAWNAPCMLTSIPRYAAGILGR